MIPRLHSKTAYPKPWGLICHGNSITNGPGGQTPWPTQIVPLVAAKTKWVWNFGYVGYAIDQLIPQSPINPPQQRDNFRIVAVLQEATNSIFNMIYGNTVPLILSQLEEWCSIYRAVGAKIIMPTTIKAGTFSPTMEAARLEINEWIRAAPAAGTIDAVCDLESLFPDPTDTEKYLVDTIHPTTVGYGLMAVALAPVVLDLITQE